jgi:hypothetical protein
MTRYWFRPKHFGYGATPCTWEGWLFTGAVLASAFACAELARRYAPVTPGDLVHAARFWLAVGGGFLVVGGGAFVSYLKTEGGWRWRGSR